MSVRGYVYAATRAAAVVAVVLELQGRSADLSRQPDRLREWFEEAFWRDELGSYALALDGDKRPCRVRSSNAGRSGRRNAIFELMARIGHQISFGPSASPAD